MKKKSPARRWVLLSLLGFGLFGVWRWVRPPELRLAGMDVKAGKFDRKEQTLDFVLLFSSKGTVPSLEPSDFSLLFLNKEFNVLQSGANRSSSLRNVQGPVMDEQGNRRYSFETTVPLSTFVWLNNSRQPFEMTLGMRWKAESVWYRGRVFHTDFQMKAQSQLVSKGEHLWLNLVCALVRTPKTTQQWIW